MPKIPASVLFFALVAGLLFCPAAARAAEGEAAGRVLSVSEFVREASRADTEFDAILIDNLTLAYSRTLNLPAGDVVLGVKAQYDFFLSPEDKQEPDAEISLSKLFPMHGTVLSAGYANSPSSGADDSASELSFALSQPIAENAFGRATRMRDRIIGMETDIARYQIVEAYEDYLASLLSLYCDWYSAWENLRIGEASHAANLKLLDNIYERRRNKIALPVDVHKVELLVLEKKEAVVSLRETYESYVNLVRKALRADAAASLVPAAPEGLDAEGLDFAAACGRFTAESRTYAVLALLENKGVLENDEAADALLPSANLLVGYRRSGTDWGVDDADDMVFAGLSMDWPVRDTVGRAEQKVSEITLRKTRLSSRNKRLELAAELRNLYLSIEREKGLIAIAQEKIGLSEKILADEVENYSLGKITLNDYISAVTQLDTNRFAKITHSVRLAKLVVEWRRLTDRLVDGKVLEKEIAEN